MANRREKVEAVTDVISLGSKITADGDCSHENKRHLLLGRKAMTKLDSILKGRQHFANRGPYSQSYGFSSSYVQMSKLDHKEGWVPKKWCLQTVLLEKSLKSHLDSKEIKSVNPKGNQFWIFIRRTDAEAEDPKRWPPDMQSWLIGKNTDAVLGAGAPPMAKVMRKEARHTQRQDRASEVPLEILEHLPPKPESAYFLLWALIYNFDYGGLPPTTSLWKKS